MYSASNNYNSGNISGNISGNNNAYSDSKFHAYRPVFPTVTATDTTFVPPPTNTTTTTSATRPVVDYTHLIQQPSQMSGMSSGNHTVLGSNDQQQPMDSIGAAGDMSIAETVARLIRDVDSKVTASGLTSNLVPNNSGNSSIPAPLGFPSPTVSVANNTMNNMGNNVTNNMFGTPVDANNINNMMNTMLINVMNNATNNTTTMNMNPTNMMMIQQVMMSMNMNPVAMTMMMSWTQQLWQLVSQFIVQIQSNGGNPMLAMQLALARNVTAFSTDIHDLTNILIGSNKSSNTSTTTASTTTVPGYSSNLSTSNTTDWMSSNVDSKYNVNIPMMSSYGSSSSNTGIGLTGCEMSPSTLLGCNNKRESTSNNAKKVPSDLNDNVVMIKKVKRDPIATIVGTTSSSSIAMPSTSALERFGVVHNTTMNDTVEAIATTSAVSDVNRNEVVPDSSHSILPVTSHSEQTMAIPSSTDALTGLNSVLNSDTAIANSLLALSSSNVSPSLSSSLVPPVSSTSSYPLVTSSNYNVLGSSNAAIATNAEAMLEMMLSGGKNTTNRGGSSSSAGTLTASGTSSGITSSYMVRDYIEPTNNTTSVIGNSMDNTLDDGDDDDDECYFVPGMKRKRNSYINKISFYAWDGLLIEHVKNYDNTDLVNVPTLHEWLCIFANNDITTSYEYSVFVRIASDEYINDIITTLKVYAISHQKKNDSVYKREFGWMYLKDQLKFGRTQMLSTIYWTIFVVYMYHHSDYQQYKITDDEFRIKYVLSNVHSSNNTTSNNVIGNSNGISGSSTTFNGIVTSNAGNALFNNLDEVEFKRLVQFRNVLAIAYHILPAHRNEVLLLRIAACLERSGKKYQISSSGQMMATTRRRLIYRREANLKHPINTLFKKEG